MNLDKEGLDLIKRFEGCKLQAYLCSAGVPTIGVGNTYYEDGTKVKLGDEITQEKADELFSMIVKKYEDTVNQLVKSKINQHQFNSLVSLTYNIGAGNFQKSSVLKKVNLNPADATIKDSFLLWNKANGKVIKGLVTRRNAEADLYFTKSTMY